MVSYLVLRLRLESGFGSTIQETLAWDCTSWSVSGGSSCQTRGQVTDRRAASRKGTLPRGSLLL